MCRSPVTSTVKAGAVTVLSTFEDRSMSSDRTYTVLTETATVSAANRRCPLDGARRVRGSTFECRRLGEFGFVDAQVL